MTSKTDKLDLRITFKVENSWSFGEKQTTFDGWVQYMVEPERGDDSGLRNPTDSHFGDERISSLYSLGVTAYYREDMGGWYGWRCVFRQPYEVDLRQAQRMVKVLRKLERAMDKMDVEFGKPTDFAGYISRVARALGATDPRPFGQYFKDMQMNGTNYRWYDVDGLRYALDQAVAPKAPEYELNV